MSTPAVRIDGLRQTFRSGRETVTAVHDVSLTVSTGEVVALLGPNGAGKTTPLDVVLGLTRPTAGRVEVAGLPPRQAVADGRVSAVLQSASLLGDLRVSETMQWVASQFSGRTMSVDQALGAAGIQDLAGRRVSRLSGGEEQRLRFALALLPDPELLVLDEPTAGMDVTGRRIFWAAMHADAAAGRTVVFATHYLEEAEAFADRIVLLAAGRVVADGSVEEIRSRVAGRLVECRLGEAWSRPRLRDLLAGRVEAEVAEIGLTEDASGRRAVFRTADSDAVARVLLAETDAHDLVIARGSLDDAFVALTSAASAPTDVPAAPSTIGASR